MLIRWRRLEAHKVRSLVRMLVLPVELVEEQILLLNLYRLLISQPQHTSIFNRLLWITFHCISKERSLQSISYKNATLNCNWFLTVHMHTLEIFDLSFRSIQFSRFEKFFTLGLTRRNVVEKSGKVSVHVTSRIFFADELWWGSNCTVDWKCMQRSYGDSRFARVHKNSMDHTFVFPIAKYLSS